MRANAEMMPVSSSDLSDSRACSLVISDAFQSSSAAELRSLVMALMAAAGVEMAVGLDIAEGVCGCGCGSVGVGG